MSTQTSGNAVRTEYQNDDVRIKPALDLLSSIMIFRCINAIIGKLVMTKQTDNLIYKKVNHKKILR